MKSILSAVQKQNIPIKPTIVISNKPSAKGLKIASKLGVQTEIVESKGFQGTRWEYDQKIFFGRNMIKKIFFLIFFGSQKSYLKLI